MPRPRRSHSNLENQPTRIDEASMMIVSLEKQKASHRQALDLLLQSRDPPKADVKRLEALIRETNERLHEAKAVQERIIRAAMRV